MALSIVAASTRSALRAAADAGRTLPVPARAVVARSGSSGITRTVSFAPSCPFRASRAKKMVCRAATSEAPPTVKIDNQSDPFATIVTVELGDEIQDMFETVSALRNLGLNIRKAKVTTGSAGMLQNRFYLTEASTSEKIVKSMRLEEIRVTVIDSIMNEYPEASSGSFAMGSSGNASDGTSPLGSYRKMVHTTIDVEEAPNGSCSVLKIETADRAGLLVDIVRVLKDINLNVVSAEVDTIGKTAHDEFFVTYRGEPLATPMVTLVTNALQYYLSLAEVATEESY